MQVFRSLAEIPSGLGPAALTIGTFDGVHRGHQVVLNRLRAVADAEECPAAVITFTNHPRDVLRADRTVETLCDPAQKVRLLESHGVDILILLTFDEELSQHTADQFLHEVSTALPFSHLVLGHDSRFGKDRGGTPDRVSKLAGEMHFALEYLPALDVDEAPISSTRIRALIREGCLAEAADLLGHEYQLSGEVVRGQGDGKRLGFPTANVYPVHRCLPPFGVYVATADGRPGVANLGLAPTLQQLTVPRLEVHLFDTSEDLYGKRLDVTLHHFLRPEKTFTSEGELRAQIAVDVESARRLRA
jgi:riboflavin kinase/FMN adenylyltransferase